jgi:hypothetical protein
MYVKIPGDKRRMQLKRIYRMPKYYCINDIKIDIDDVLLTIICYSSSATYTICFRNRRYDWELATIYGAPFYIVCAVLKQYSSKDHIDVRICGDWTAEAYDYRVEMYSITTDKSGSESIFVNRYNEYIHATENRYKKKLCEDKQYDCKIIILD